MKFLFSVMVLFSSVVATAANECAQFPGTYLTPAYTCCPYGTFDNGEGACESSTPQPRCEGSYVEVVPGICCPPGHEYVGYGKCSPRTRIVEGGVVSGRAGKHRRGKR